LSLPVTTASSRANPNEQIKTARSLCLQGFESPCCRVLQSKAFLMSSEDQDFDGTAAHGTAALSVESHSLASCFLWEINKTILKTLPDHT
jgi:hypothetical protein